MSDNFLEAEHRVIGALLLDNSLISEIDLTPLDFCDATMSQVFGAIRDLDREKKPFDVFTVGDELERTTGRNWLPTVATIAKEAPSSKNIKTYAEYVKKYRRNRDARAIAKRLAEGVSQDDGAIDQAIADLMALDNKNHETLFTMRQAAEIAYQKLDEAHKRKGELTGITSGLADLDKATGGFQDSDLIIVGARPAMGKTGFLLNVALKCGVPCGIQSAEMSAGQLAQRSLSTTSRINSWKVRTADLDPDDWSEISTAFSLLVGMPIYIDDQSSPTIADVQRQARKLKQKYGIKILLVDYLQRIEGNNPKASKIDQVGEVTKGLKSLAKELNIPVVALAQVNRNVDQRTNSRPQMGDLSDSSQIEKEADVIMMLYRDEVYNPDTDEKGIAEINIEKNRHGPTGEIRVAWVADCMRFENLATKWESQRYGS
jgi:replicative DNA helicase